MSTRHVTFVTGARSEYDLIVPAAAALRAFEGVRVSFTVGASHLSPFHGRTIELVRADGFEVLAELESLIASDTDYARCASFARLTDGLAATLSRADVDVVVVTGDREEALAGALAAAFMRTACVHVHGGDRCIASDIDEVIRPAVSKLATYHCVATEGHRQRLVAMGELPQHVFVTGAPGIDRLLAEPDVADAEVTERFGLTPGEPCLLVMHHPPAWLGPELGVAELRAILDAAERLGMRTFCGMPNTDQGNVAMRELLVERQARWPLLTLYHTLPRRDFVALYRRASAIVGNSSSLVIESGALGVPAVLVGDRQKYREHGDNLAAVPADADAVFGSLRRAVYDSDYRASVRAAGSPYGDGHAGPRIARVIGGLELDPADLLKTMPY